MKKVFKILVAADIVLINFAIFFVLYQSLFLQKDKVQAEKTGNTQSLINQANLNSACSDPCLSYIDDRLAASVSSNIVGISPTKALTPTKIPQTTTVQKVKRVYYVPIPGSGRTLQTVWTDLTGTDFYFDKADYPGYKESYFEANMSLFNGNGSAYVRIFDVTHSISVIGSEVTTQNQASTLIESTKLNFYSGKNQYRVQAKSLTADTTIFESGRIRVITEE